jgi:hypothetical protein
VVTGTLLATSTLLQAMEAYFSFVHYLGFGERARIQEKKSDEAQ